MTHAMIQLSLYVQGISQAGLVLIIAGEGIRKTAMVRDAFMPTPILVPTVHAECHVYTAQPVCTKQQQMQILTRCNCTLVQARQLPQ